MKKGVDYLFSRHLPPHVTMVDQLYDHRRPEFNIIEPEALLVHTTQFIFRSTVALGPKNLTLIRMTDAFLKIL